MPHWQQSIRECRRVLKKGGHLVLAVWSKREDVSSKQPEAGWPTLVMTALPRPRLRPRWPSCWTASRPCCFPVSSHPLIPSASVRASPGLGNVASGFESFLLPGQVTRPS